MRRKAWMDEINSLGDFLSQELNKRKMSAREFANFVGVSNKTISAHIDPIL